MTTPNIEELIAVLEATNQFHDNADICTADVIAALQTQAERIKELEAAPQVGYFYKWKEAMHGIARLMDERDTLRAQLAEIENVEPVIWAISYDGVTPYTLWHEGNGPLLDYEVKRQGGTTQKMPLYTRPMPAQDVTELVEALEKLARLGNGDQYGNSDGNMIARTALSKYKGAK